MRRCAGPVIEILVCPTRISVTGLEMFRYEQASPVNGMKNFLNMHASQLKEDEFRSISPYLLDFFDQNN